ncbi:amidohydrolase/deacetylase family metallohydrolase [Stella sp.]|uniref:amidohydrolase/deacetylase family metallohydrolase n=1 Tax=Stella sp. TaxID=2912054 RepID=UPI0035B2FE73
MTELVLKGGRVLDPGRGVDQIADVAFADGRVRAIGPDLAVPAGAEVKDVRGLIVTPGLIDLHTHVYWGGTSLGVDPLSVARQMASPTLIDAGSAGAGTLHGFRKFLIDGAPIRILPYLNLSYPGIFAFSQAVMVGECADIRLLDSRECAKVAAANRDIVVGIKVRVGRSASGTSGIAPLDMALDVAEEVGMPVMCHLDNPPPSRLEVIQRLRPGDVLTHCFRPFPNAPVTPDGRVREEIAAARERGVLFDIGHGGGSFGFKTTRGMLAAGFLPDVISSDIHEISIHGPAYDLLVTLSKFVCLGVPLPEVIRRATQTAGQAVQRPELGKLVEGGIGDASVLELAEGEWSYRDVLGERLAGKQRLLARGMVASGRWFDPAAQPTIS